MIYKRDWNPVLDGEVYCSPACGFKCTKTAYDIAVARADEMVAVLGDGWEPDVWENCRWNYAAKHKKQDIRIHAERSFKTDTVREYTCFYNGPKQMIGKGENPNAAFIDAQIQMIRLSNEINESLENL